MRRRSYYFAKSLKRLQRRSKKFLMLAADAVAIPAALVTAIALRLGSFEPAWNLQVAEVALAAVATTLPLFARIGLYRAVIRFLSAHAAIIIALGVAASTGVVMGLGRLVLDPPLPYTVAAIYFLLASFYVGVTRFAMREFLRIRISGVKRVVVYGAGSAGAQVCASLKTRGQYRPVAIVDDNPAMHGAQVCGVRVYSPDRLPELRRRYGVSVVLLAIPAATRRRRSDVIERLSPDMHHRGHRSRLSAR